MNKTAFKEFDVELVDSWKCPEGNVPIITMPNIYRALHTVAPRTVLGKSVWDHMRRKCYFDANYKCEICGAEGKIHAHELYEINWKEGYSKFVRCVCTCVRCHTLCIHNGRALTLHKRGNPVYPAYKLLDAAEHAFKLVSDYNKEHPGADLKLYATYLDYLKCPDLEEPMRELIKKYGVKFYFENDKHVADWDKWRLIIGDKEYYSPFKDEDDWDAQMMKRDEADEQRNVEDPFSGGIYDTIKQELKDDLDNNSDNNLENG